MTKDYVTQNLCLVRDEIARAEREAGREGKTLMLAAVKYADDAELSTLLCAGVSAVGENRVQQLLAHWPILEKSEVKVHFIGSLQTNKVKYIIDKVEMIHSIDSERLADEVERQAAKRALTVRVLVEINGGREESKSGVLPEQVVPLCRKVLACPHLELCGFMTMGGRFASHAEYQAYFESVRELGRAAFAELGLGKEPILSMGMSESFPAAIAAGADIVRVGRRLFAGAACDTNIEK